MDVRDEDTAAGLGMPPLHDHDAQTLVLALGDVDLPESLVLALVPLQRVVLVRLGGELRQRLDGQVIYSVVSPPEHERHVRFRKILLSACQKYR